MILQKTKEEFILNKFESDNFSNVTNLLQRINRLISVIDKNCMEKIRKSNLSNEEKICQLLEIIQVIDGKQELSNKEYTKYFTQLFSNINDINNSYIYEYIHNSLKKRCIQHINELENGF